VAATGGLSGSLPEPRTGLRGAFGRPTFLEVRGRWEAAALERDPLWQGEGVQPGEGRPVLLVPGVLANPRSLARLEDWLRRCGYDAHRAALGRNTGPSPRGVDAVERAVADAAPGLIVIGHSRGGQLARVAVARRPDGVALLVTLGSPFRPALPPHVVMAGVASSLRLVGRWRGADRQVVAAGERRFAEDLVAPFPDHVPFLSVWSKRDGFIDWRACLDPGAEHAELSVSHFGLAASLPSYRVIADALGRLPRGGVRR
jgi:pimeloyl-ACP methyl ester carboxylesterase